MPFMLKFVVVITVLGFLILVHELGHFLVARWTGMRVYEFAIGFGPPLLSWRRNGILYTLRAFFLGGFVRIAGMGDPEEDPDIPGGFLTRPLWQRLAVLVAGAAMNIVAAVVLFCLIGMVWGLPAPDQTTARIAAVLDGWPAQEAGLEPGDTIIGINGRPEDDIEEIRRQIAARPDTPLNLLIRRGEQEFERAVVPRPQDDYEWDEGQQKLVPATTGMIGIRFEQARRRAGAWESVRNGFLGAIYTTLGLLGGLLMMVTGRAPMAVGGPARIVQEITIQAQLGADALIEFAGLLSVNLAILNLLPIPALDGGRIGVQLVSGILEKVRGRPLDPRKEALVHMVGMLLLMGFILYVSVIDIQRWRGQ